MDPFSAANLLNKSQLPSNNNGNGNDKLCIRFCRRKHTCWLAFCLLLSSISYIIAQVDMTLNMKTEFLNQTSRFLIFFDKIRQALNETRQSG